MRFGLMALLLVGCMPASNGNGGEDVQLEAPRCERKACPVGTEVSWTWFTDGGNEVTLSEQSPGDEYWLAKIECEDPDAPPVESVSIAYFYEGSHILFGSYDDPSGGPLVGIRDLTGTHPVSIHCAPGQEFAYRRVTGAQSEPRRLRTEEWPENNPDGYVPPQADGTPAR